MDDFTSRQLIQKIEYGLKEVTNEVFNNPDYIDNLEQVIVSKVHSKIGGLSRSLSFSFSIPREIEVKNISYSPKASKNGVISGEIIIEHCKQRDVHKYGGPGYPGKEHGQLCEYPEHSRKFYKWDNFLCKWQDIYHSIDRGNNNEQSWSDKLTNNAAFEPWWGNNKRMDGIKSDRKRNGADDLWGDPGIRKFNSTFKQISADVMKSIYNFTYDFKTVLKYYTKLGTAFGYGNEENNSTTSNNNGVYTTEEEPKVTITIEKLYRWHMWESNGSIQQSGMGVRKDTAVYIKDTNAVRKMYKRKKEEIIYEERERFNKNN